MNENELKAEFEKRIDTLVIYVHRLSIPVGGKPHLKPAGEPDDDLTVYRIRIAGQNSHAEWRLSARQLEYARDVGALIDSIAHSLVHMWADQRYLRKAKVAA